MNLKALFILSITLTFSPNIFGQQESRAMISAGRFHNLVLAEDGNVFAWGSSNSNQCAVPSGLKAVAISAGMHHSLALTEDGEVIAWGRSDVPIDLKAVAISAGANHNLAITGDGTVVAWGNNDKKQCKVPKGLKAVAISAGKEHSLALKEDGTVVAWGGNDHHQCDVPRGLKAVAISAAEDYNLALREDGTVAAWGDCSSNQCNVPQGLKAVSISAGSRHCLALKMDGTVVAWGDCSSNQCGIPPDLKASSISAGGWHCLALDTDMSVVAWGINDFELSSVPKEYVSLARVESDRQATALQVKAGSIKLSGSPSINGMDSKTLNFELINNSSENATGLTAHIHLEQQTHGILIPEILHLPTITALGSAHCEIPISSDRTTVDGVVKIVVTVLESNGFSQTHFALEVPTTSFQTPMIKVVDFSCTSKAWEPLKPIGLEVLIKNIGIGNAEKVKVELVLPPYVICNSKNESIVIDNLRKGEMVTIKYNLLAPEYFNESAINITVKLSELHGDYGSLWAHEFQVEHESNDSAFQITENEAHSREKKREEESFSPRTGGGKVTFRATNADHIVTTVAVVPKQGHDCSGAEINGDELAKYTENQLLGTYNIVDRKFIDQTLGEIKFTMSGMTKEDQILEAGCMLAAEGYVFVEYGCFEGSETVNIKMIHCESGENMWISQGIGASAAETVQSIIVGLAE